MLYRENADKEGDLDLNPLSPAMKKRRPMSYLCLVWRKKMRVYVPKSFSQLMWDK